MYKHRYSIPKFAYVFIGTVPIIAAFFCLLIIFSAILLCFSDPLARLPVFSLLIPLLSGFIGGFFNVRFINFSRVMPILSAALCALIYFTVALIVCKGAFSLMHFLNALTLLLATLIATVVFGGKKGKKHHRKAHCT